MKTNRCIDCNKIIWKYAKRCKQCLGIFKRIKISDILHKKFNKLTVISFSHMKKEKWNEYYYKCLCECGNIKIINRHSLLNNHIKSCGCLKYDNPNLIRTKKGDTSCIAIYGSYKHRAKQKKIKFTLSLQEFKKLTKLNCYYCNQKPQTKYKAHNANGYYIYNGLDRLNNKLGYTRKNSVPCCKNCNYAKKSMTIEEFKKWIKQVYDYLIHQ